MMARNELLPTLPEPYLKLNNYSVTRKELLAMVTFISHFRQYLLGRTFTLCTDHSSLTWLRNFKQPEGQLARWLEKLEEFSLTVQHRPGRKHNNADSLSRLNAPLHINATTSSDTVSWGMTASEIRSLQLKDEIISPVLIAKETKQRPSYDTLSKYTFKTRKLFQLWDQLFVDNGILLRLFLNTDTQQTYKQLVVPKCLQADILQQLHSGVVGGHLGKAKTLGKLKSQYYWPGHYHDVQITVIHVLPVLLVKLQHHRSEAHYKTLQLAVPCKW